MPTLTIVPDVPHDLIDTIVDGEDTREWFISSISAGRKRDREQPILRIVLDAVHERAADHYVRECKVALATGLTRPQLVTLAASFSDPAVREANRAFRKALECVDVNALMMSAAEEISVEGVPALRGRL